MSIVGLQLSQRYEPVKSLSACDMACGDEILTKIAGPLRCFRDLGDNNAYKRMDLAFILAPQGIHAVVDDKILDVRAIDDRFCFVAFVGSLQNGVEKLVFRSEVLVQRRCGDVRISCDVRYCRT